MSKTIPTKDITTELIEDTTRELNGIVRRFESELSNLKQVQLFQEKHTTGKWWNRKHYYTYWKYGEGGMYQVSIYPKSTVESIERGD